MHGDVIVNVRENVDVNANVNMGGGVNTAKRNTTTHEMSRHGPVRLAASATQLSRVFSPFPPAVGVVTNMMYLCTAARGG